MMVPSVIVWLYRLCWFIRLQRTERAKYQKGTSPMPKQTPSNPKRTGARVVPIRGTSTPTTPAASKPATLAPIQELLCELAGDLIVRGGNREECENLARVLLRHQFRTGLGVQDESTESAMQAWDHSERNLSDWMGKWSKALSKTVRSAPESSATGESISDRIRANLRSHVYNLMESFAGGATPEELGFMSDVLVNWEDKHLLSHGDPVQEVYIADAFITSLGEYDGASIFVRVPERLLPAVQRLARLEMETA